MARCSPRCWQKTLVLSAPQNNGLVACVSDCLLPFQPYFVWLYSVNIKCVSCGRQRDLSVAHYSVVAGMKWSIVRFCFVFSDFKAHSYHSASIRDLSASHINGLTLRFRKQTNLICQRSCWHFTNIDRITNRTRIAWDATDRLDSSLWNAVAVLHSQVWRNDAETFLTASSASPTPCFCQCWLRIKDSVAYWTSQLLLQRWSLCGQISFFLLLLEETNFTHRRNHNFALVHWSADKSKARHGFPFLSSSFFNFEIQSPQNAVQWRWVVSGYVAALSSGVALFSRELALQSSRLTQKLFVACSWCIQSGPKCWKLSLIFIVFVGRSLKLFFRKWLKQNLNVWKRKTRTAEAESRERKEKGPQNIAGNIVAELIWIPPARSRNNKVVPEATLRSLREFSISLIVSFECDHWRSYYICTQVLNFKPIWISVLHSLIWRSNEKRKGIASEFMWKKFYAHRWSSRNSET